MTELEKLNAGLPYCYVDAEMIARKSRAIKWCEEYNAIDGTDYEAQYKYLQKMLGTVGERFWISKTFGCDCGKNIFIGDDFTCNFNLTILPGVTIGNNVVIAAGAVVHEDIPDNCLVGGVPASKIKDLENDV